MNEKIKEFAEQVGFKPYYEKGTGELDSNGNMISYPFWDITDPNVSRINEFAELIVKDLCEWIEGVPTSEEGMILLTKSFIVSNLKGRYNVLS